MNELKNSLAGRQVLTIIYSDDIAEKPVSMSGAAMELIGTCEQLELHDE